MSCRLSQGKSDAEGSSRSGVEPRIHRNLQSRIKAGLGAHLGLTVTDVRVQDNKEKYHDPRNPLVAGAELEEVFGLMRGLNEQVLGNARICADARGTASFRDTLEEAVADICRCTRGRTFDYVELGPEPTKTCFIIRRLLEEGTRVVNYVSVDINPASNDVMRDRLSGLMPAERIHHRITSFERLRHDDIREDGRPALVTTLGFQEGNEDPEGLPAFYRRLLLPGDLLLSEMQLRPAADWQPVEAFYRHPYMQRFSRLAFERLYGDVPSKTGFALVPVGTLGEDELAAAVLYERPVANDIALPKAFITNYCLKYSAAQFAQMRRTSGCLEVVSQRLTGDRSIAFQLSIRQ